MSTQHHGAALAILTLGFAVAPHASAALWSSTNTVAGISEMATMEIGVTGDQITTGTQVDITIPAGITNVTVTPLNGAGCAYLAASRTVRVIAVDVMLNPLPLWARPLCTIQYRVSRSTSTWFRMHGAECVTVDLVVLPPSQCALDDGYLTVRR
jgi:hypothetical protein